MKIKIDLEETISLIKWLIVWEDNHVNDTLPLRNAADDGRGSYDAYDEMYKYNLESLHSRISDYLQYVEHEPPPKQ